MTGLSSFSLRTLDPGLQTLFFQMVGHARDDDAAAEEERAFQEERTLVVQEVLPPARWHELGEHDRDDVDVPAAADAVEVAQERAYERAVGRRQHDQFDTRAPLLPLLFELARRLLVDVHVD